MRIAIQRIRYCRTTFTVVATAVHVDVTHFHSYAPVYTLVTHLSAGSHLVTVLIQQSTNLTIPKFSDSAPTPAPKSSLEGYFELAGFHGTHSRAIVIIITVDAKSITPYKKAVLNADHRVKALTHYTSQCRYALSPYSIQVHL